MSHNPQFERVRRCSEACRDPNAASRLRKWQLRGSEQAGRTSSGMASELYPSWVSCCLTSASYSDASELIAQKMSWVGEAGASINATCTYMCVLAVSFLADEINLHSYTGQEEHLILTSPTKQLAAWVLLGAPAGDSAAR